MSEHDLDTAAEGRYGDDETDGEFSRATLDRMEAFLDAHGYLSWLGVTIETIAPGRAVMSMPYREELTNPTSRETPRLHGGIPATLIDTASAFALRTAFDDPGQAALTTTDLDVSYLRPAAADLRVEAETVRAGTKIGVTRASVTSVAPDGERKEVAIGTTTYRLFRDPGGNGSDVESEGTAETPAEDER